MSQQALEVELMPDADVEGIATEVEKFYKTDTGFKLRLAYNWYYNIRMYQGDHHGFYNYAFDRTTGNTPITTGRRSDTLRPTTNYVRAMSRTIITMLTKSRPTPSIRPKSDDPRDISASKVSRTILDVLEEDLEEHEKRIEAAMWGYITGTAIFKSFWDTTRERVSRMPIYEMLKEEVKESVEFCPQCQFERPVTDENRTVCPKCKGQLQREVRQTLNEAGQPMFRERKSQLFDKETGKPVFKELRVGDINTAIIPPFSFAQDPRAENLEGCHWVMEYSIHTLDWIREMFTRPGTKYFTNRADEVQEEKSLNNILTIHERLKYIESQGGYYSSGAGGYQDTVMNAAVVKECYLKPTKDHPQGRQIIVASGIPLYLGPSIYNWHPYTMFRCDLIPGRFWGGTPFDDMVKKQRQLNACDAVIISTRRTMGTPQWLNPLGSKVPNGYLSGQPGLVIRHAPGLPPIRIPAEGVNPQVLAERAQILMDMREISGTQSVLEGRPPGSVSAASALALLNEQATSQHSTMVHLWEKFLEKHETKKLRLLQRMYKEPRQDFINRLRVANHELTDMDIDHFIGADLRDNVRVRMEIGSSIPKSKAFEQATLLELAATGALGDIIGNPVNQHKFLEKLGIGGFDYEDSPDVKRAEWENSNLDKGRIEVVGVFEWDNHQIHMQKHTNRTKRPDFYKLPDNIKQSYIVHIGQHKEIMEAMMMRASAQQGQAMDLAGVPRKPGMRGGGNGKRGAPAPR